MGNKSNKEVSIPQLKNSEIHEYSKQTLFSREQIEKLYYHFYKISTSECDDGVIDFSEFCLNLNHTGQTFINERIFNLFDANKDGVINFREFLLGLSTFVIPKEDTRLEMTRPLSASRFKDQIEVSFRMLDMQRSGKIYIKDLKKLISSALHDNHAFKLTEDQIDEMLTRTFNETDTEEDESGLFICKQAYKNMVLANPGMLKWLSVDIDKAMMGSKSSYKRNKSRCLSL